MGSPRVDFYFHQAVGTVAGKALKLCKGKFSVSFQIRRLKTLSVVAVPGKFCPYKSFPYRRMPLTDADVNLGQRFVIFKLASKKFFRLPVFCRYYDTGGVLVQTVNNSRAPGFKNFRIFIFILGNRFPSPMVKKCVYKGSV